MKILIIGGMHGNEPLGIGLVKKLSETPIPSVSAVIANDTAVTQNVRFVTNDLNRSFPGKAGGSDEEKRAKELLELCKDYDLVLDFHNTHCPDNNCSFLGDTAKKSLYAVSSKLGLNRIIVADYDCLNKYAPNCLSVEISMDSSENNVEVWYKKIKDLQTSNLLPDPKRIETYRFVYRMTLEDRDRFALTALELKAFTPLKKDICNKLGVTSPAYPIFIDDAFTPYNYGGLLNRLN